MVEKRIAGYPLPAGNQGQSGKSNERFVRTARLSDLLELSGKKGLLRGSDFHQGKTAQTKNSFGATAFDTEGRVIISEYPEFTLCNVYFPNGKQSTERLKYKLDFYDAFFNFLEPLRLRGDKIIFCGDVNTAHTEIDIARPKENQKISGFLPEERAWLDKIVAHGYIDTFRHFNKEPGQYTWWDMKTGARERNVGWRIDYFFVTENLIDYVKKAFIMKDVTGSDHCPIGLVLEFD